MADVLGKRVSTATTTVATAAFVLLTMLVPNREHWDALVVVEAFFLGLVLPIMVALALVWIWRAKRFAFAVMLGWLPALGIVFAGVISVLSSPYWD